MRYNDRHGQQASYVYDVIANTPYRILNDHLTLLLTIALPAMLKFQFRQFNGPKDET
jgi:hypothetical protein